MVAIRKKKKVVKYDTDDAARNIWLHLLRDFRTTQGDSFAMNAEHAFRGGFAHFRDYVFPELGIIPVDRFKRYHQLQNLLKKYSAKVDKYCEADLLAKTTDSFFENQERICRCPSHKMSTHLVLQRARIICKRILGEFDSEYVMQHTRFGKKSSIGCPLSLAYIDRKLSDVGAFSGSSECATWFRHEYLKTDTILASIVEPLLGDFPTLAHDSLNLVFVPKSWKTLRAITPLTLLALFYSYGVGELVSDRLRVAGLDIRRLQNRHRVLIQNFSRRRDTDFFGGSHATADLSSASDSLTSELLNRVLPRTWYNACKKTFTHQLVVDGVGHYTASVLPMGNGLTFPVETLVFYSLIKAIGELSGTEGIYSVYGDDLIYPVRIHHYVYGVFNSIGLLMNGDKTFVHAPFRESCGSDFYRGVDVRPFFLPAADRMLTRSQYIAWLYQTYNGLTRRWDPLEVPGTLKYILAELVHISPNPLYRVPPLFPDTSGIKVEWPTERPMDFDHWSPVRIYFANGSSWFHFKYLSASADRRWVTSVMPYYWLALRGLDDDPVEKNYWVTDFSFYNEAPASGLRWHCVETRRYRIGGRVRVKRKYRASCAKRVKFLSYGTCKTKPGSISDWL